MPRVAFHRRTEGPKHGRLLSAVMMAAIVVIAGFPTTRTWSQQRSAAGQQLLFEPSALRAEPGTFDRHAASPSAAPAGQSDDAERKHQGVRSFAPLRSNGALALPSAARPVPDLGRAAREPPGVFGQTKIESFSLGLETEHHFKPDELPGGEKTHALTYKRELHPKPFLGLSLTSPIE